MVKYVPYLVDILTNFTNITKLKKSDTILNLQGAYR